MGQFVYDQNLSDQQVSDGLIINIKSPKINQLSNANVDSISGVGTGIWGPFDTRIKMRTQYDQLAKIGAQVVEETDLATFANLAWQGDGSSSVTEVNFVRIGSGTQTASILLIAGATHAIATLTGLYEGTLLDSAGANAKLTYSPSTPLAQQTTGPNTQKVYVDLTISIPGYGVEIYKNLDGNTFSSPNYNLDGPTLGAAIIAAVNTGQVNGRGPSQYFVASVGVSSPGHPVMNTANVITTAGSNGLDFGSPNPTYVAQALGQNTTFPYTGMWALAGGISGSAFFIAGGTDLADLDVEVLAFTKSQNAYYCMSVPEGTDTAGVLVIKTGLAISDIATPTLPGSSYAALFDGNWPQITDFVNGNITRSLDPAGIAAIRIAITGVPNSPANLGLPFITGTDRVNALVAPQDYYTEGETIALENAGVNYFSNQTSGNDGFSIGHNYGSLGKAATPRFSGTIAYARVIEFEAKTLNSSLLGKAVGLAQDFATSGQDGQDNRKRLSALVNANLTEQIAKGIVDGDTIAICDLTNNTEGNGQLNVSVRLVQKEIIDNVIVGITPSLAQIVAINPNL